MKTQTNTKGDRDKPEAVKVPGVVMCRHLLTVCVYEHVCVCGPHVLICMCLCGPLEAGNRGRIEVLLIISPKASHWRLALNLWKLQKHTLTVTHIQILRGLM